MYDMEFGQRRPEDQLSTYQGYGEPYPAQQFGGGYGLAEGGAPASYPHSSYPPAPYYPPSQGYYPSEDMTLYGGVRGGDEGR